MSKVVVMTEALAVNLDCISIIHFVVLQDGNVPEIIVVPTKRSCVGFEKEIGLIVAMFQVTVLGWFDLGVVGFVS